eukprot:g19876.t1
MNKKNKQLQDVKEMRFGLSDLQIGELKEAFSLYDKSNNGVITWEDLGKVMSSLDPELKPTDEELKRLIQEVDTVGDGDLNFTDFLRMMSEKLKHLDQEQEVKQAFQVMDPYDKGSITMEQLRAVMAKLGEELTQQDLDLVKRRVGSDTIEFDQFLSLMTQGD